MNVAPQLRLAIGVLIVLLAGILAAALYVPAQLEESANEKYVNDVIPLRSLVHQLKEEVLEQERALQSYLLTQKREDRERFDSAKANASRVLIELEPYARRHPWLEQLRSDATIQIGDLVAFFDIQRRATTPGQRQSIAPEIERAIGELDATSEQMLRRTDALVNEASREQSRLYRQLLIVLLSLGSLALLIGLALYVFLPRRVGQLYEDEQQSRHEAESRAEAGRALEHVSDGVILTDVDGRVRFWNPAAEKLTGIDEHGATGRELVRLLPGLERIAQQPDAHSGVGGAAVVPIELGHERWLSVTSVDFGEGVVYAVRDVTEERALETMRSDFVATASHELRTPMTSISGAARTLLRRGHELEPERRETFLEMIVSESDRLKRIVDQILLASRIEAGSLDVHRQRCDAASIVESVVDATAHGAPEHVRLEIDVENDLPDVECDPDRLRQVLVNVIDNAIKYSPDGGEVRVELEPRGDVMRFGVHDQGVGFDSAAADRIFDRFHRLDPHQTQGVGGTGLGLYISRELVQRMGGQIWAEGERGRGASFFFELPLARDAARTR